MSDLLDATYQTQKFGIDLNDNIESLGELVSQLGSTNIGKEWVIQASQMAKLFGIGAENSAKIASSFAFQNRGTEEFKKFMESTEQAANNLSLPINEVAQNIASSTISMTRFNLASKESLRRFTALAAFSTKIGKNIDEMVTALDEFRSFEGAAQGAVQFGLAGMNVNAIQLMSMARSGNPQRMIESVLKHIENYAGKNGNMQGTVAADLAESLGPMINMSREDIQQAIYRRRYDAGKSVDPLTKESLERLKSQQTLQESIDNSLKKMTMLLTPVLIKMTSMFEWLTNNTKLITGILTTIAVSLAAGTAFKMWGGIRNTVDLWRATGRQSFNWGSYSHTMRGGGGRFGNSPRGLGGLKHRLTRFGDAISLYGLGTPNPLGNVDETEERIQNRTGGMYGRKGNKLPGGRGGYKVPKGSGGGSQMDMYTGGSAGKEVLRDSKMFMAEATKMFAAAFQMVAFAGAIWILGKALRNLEGIDVKRTILPLGLALGALTAGMGIGKMGGTFQAAAGMAAIGAALWTIGSAMKFFKDVNLLNVGIGMVALAGGLAAIAAVGGIMMGVGPLAAGALAVGLGATAISIATLGKTAQKYGKPIETLSYAMERFANALAIIKSLGMKVVDIKIDAKTLTGLEKIALAYNGKIGATDSKPIEITTNLVVDGQVLARVVSEALPGLIGMSQPIPRGVR